FFFFSSRRRHTRFSRDWSSDVCSSDLHNSFGRQSLNFTEKRMIVNIGEIHTSLAARRKFFNTNERILKVIFNFTLNLFFRLTAKIAQINTGEVATSKLLIVFPKIAQEVYFLKGGAQSHRIRFEFAKSLGLPVGKDMKTHQAHYLG